MKNLLLPSVIFEELGMRYYGPIDGHDIPLLIRTFEFLKTQNEPVILHILTQKGRGYAPALEKPDKFHGLGRFEPRVDVQTRGGLLTIEWAGGDAPVYMTGPAVTVFEGEITL